MIGRAELTDGPIDLGEGGLGVVHRERGHEAGEPVRVAGDDLGHAVIGQPGQLGRDVGAAQHLDRR